MISRVPRSVFIDTHAFYAAFNADDLHHDEAREWFERIASLRTPVVTSEWVLAEFLGLAAKRTLRSAAASFVRDCRKLSHGMVVPASPATWKSAFELFASRADKDWSFIDCSTMILCKEHKIRHILTHDHHFAQAGFEILL